VRDASWQLLQQQPTTLDSLTVLLQQLRQNACTPTITPSSNPNSDSSSGSTASAAAVESALLFEKALGLVSNMSLHPGIRQQLAQQQLLLDQLLAAAGLPSTSSTAAGPRAKSAMPTNPDGSSTVRQAALGCLCNLSLEPRLQLQLADRSSAAMLLAMTTAAAGCSKERQAGDAGTASSTSGTPAAAAAAGPRLPARKPKQQQQQQAPCTQALEGGGQHQLPYDEELLTAQRAAVLLSRAAKQAEGVQQLQQLQALPQMLECIADVAAAHQQHLLNELTQQLEEDSQQQQQQQQQQRGETSTAAMLATWLDAAWRTVALLTAQPGACGSCSCSGEVAAATIAACLVVLQPTDTVTQQQQQSVSRPPSQGTSSSSSSSTSSTSQPSAAVQGNAALVLGHLAAEPCWHTQLAQADAVGVLVAVAYAHGRGRAVARNAAIALARMARDGRLMDRLRELHGVEIIYQYVRP
jgi:hypothetical protein